MSGGQLFEGIDVQMDRRSGGHTIVWTDICITRKVKLQPFVLKKEISR